MSLPQFASSRYDRVGRTEDARRALKASLDDRIARGPPGFQPLLAIRERWGRCLLEGDLDAAKAQFQEVIAQAHGRGWSHVALAYGDLARLAIIRHETQSASN